MTTTSGNELLHRHEVEYLKEKALEDHGIAGYEFRHYIDHSRCTVAFEVETNLCRKPFFIGFDRVNDLPSLNKAIWEV